MNAEQVNSWIQGWMDKHSDADSPDDVLDRITLRIGAVSILQFARDAGVISADEYQMGLNPIVQRTHPELEEVYLTVAGAEGTACIVCGASDSAMVAVAGLSSPQSAQLFRCVDCVTTDVVKTDPSTSYWLKGALSDLEARDPVDALGDAELLARLMQQRVQGALKSCG